jgi:hypothetical protein
LLLAFFTFRFVRPAHPIVEETLLYVALRAGKIGHDAVHIEADADGHHWLRMTRRRLRAIIR